MKKKGVVWLAALWAGISGAAVADDISTDALFAQMRDHQLTAIGYPVNTGGVTNGEAAKPADMEALFAAWRQDLQPTRAYYALLEKGGDGWAIRRISGTAIALAGEDTRMVSARREAVAAGDTTIASR